MKAPFSTGVRLWLILSSACLFISCSAPTNRLFERRTPHEAYENKIQNVGLQNTTLGLAWMNAAQKALLQPVPVQLPYKETGYFAAERPASVGYLFFVRRGEQLQINITTNPTASFKLFADLWQRNNNNPKLLSSADTVNHSIMYEAERDDTCIVRIQPELLSNGGYTITITTGPSLAFPVPSEDRTRVGSFWGDSRDAGARKHEGIDIFGKFRTPVVAAADGYVTGVREGGIGGKVVFLRPADKNYTLYYAHLDSQIVQEGQTIKTGDIVGLMGNTGNAKYTPTHLHFGIYTNSGAVDPLPFINKTNTQTKSITASLEYLNGYVRNKKTTDVFVSPASIKNVVEKINAGTAMRVLAATGSLYKIQLPGGLEAFINSSAVSDANGPLRSITVDSSTMLLNDASDTAIGKALIAEGSKLSVYGAYKNFYFVQSGDLKGWVKKL